MDETRIPPDYVDDRTHQAAELPPRPMTATETAAVARLAAREAVALAGPRTTVQLGRPDVLFVEHVQVGEAAEIPRMRVDWDAVNVEGWTQRERLELYTRACQAVTPGRYRLSIALERLA